MRKTTVLVASTLIAGPLLAIGGWVGAEHLLRATSGEAFCTTCHTMEPFAAAYRRDLHGGRNLAGVAARCTDCHLPHADSLGHLAAKARRGLHDVWAQMTYELDAIDWHAGRAAREDYVFDSGCLVCHSALAEARGNSRAFVAHRPYFLGETDKQCASSAPDAEQGREALGDLSRVKSIVIDRGLTLRYPH